MSPKRWGSRSTSPEPCSPAVEIRGEGGSQHQGCGNGKGQDQGCRRRGNVERHGVLVVEHPAGGEGGKRGRPRKRVLASRRRRRRSKSCKSGGKYEQGSCGGHGRGEDRSGIGRRRKSSVPFLRGHSLARSHTEARRRAMHSGERRAQAWRSRIKP